MFRMTAAEKMSQMKASVASQSSTGESPQSDKFVEIAVQTKTEVSELVRLTAEIRRELSVLTQETATVRDVCLEVKLMRSEMEAARSGGQLTTCLGSEAAGSGETVMSELKNIKADIEAVSVSVETSASKLGFLDFSGGILLSRN